MIASKYSTGSAARELAALATPWQTAGSFADFLAEQDETVVEIAGVPWMKYRAALIPATAMPVYVNVPRKEAVRALKDSHAVLLRYSTGPARTETSWWNVVCRRYDFQATSANTRSKIRRGLKRLEVRPVTPSWLAENGHGCHVRSYERYANAAPMGRRSFRCFLQSLEGHKIFDCWAAFLAGNLVGYIICLCEDDGVFLHTIDIAPAGLRAYATYALTHLVLDHYVNTNAVPVSNGSRSVSHATNMQDFLLQFGFAREYCDLNIVYHPNAELLLRSLYPFRRIVKRLGRIPLAHGISGVLFQEELVRQQKGGIT